MNLLWATFRIAMHAPASRATIGNIKHVTGMNLLPKLSVRKSAAMENFRASAL